MNKTGAAVAASATAQNVTSEDLARRAIERRAVEAVIWGMPLVNTDAMRQAYFRDVGAKYNDICYFSKPADWHVQITTPNASTNYVYCNFNSKDGPIVLEVPARRSALGCLIDAWDVLGRNYSGHRPRRREPRRGGEILVVATRFQRR